MTKDKKKAIKEIVESTKRSYNPKYGCYVEEGQNPKKALHEAQHRNSFNKNDVIGMPMIKR